MLTSFSSLRNLSRLSIETTHDLAWGLTKSDLVVSAAPVVCWKASTSFEPLPGCEPYAYGLGAWCTVAITATTRAEAPGIASARNRTPYPGRTDTSVRSRGSSRRSQHGGPLQPGRLYRCLRRTGFPGSKLSILMVKVRLYRIHFRVSSKSAPNRIRPSPLESEAAWDLCGQWELQIDSCGRFRLFASGFSVDGHTGFGQLLAGKLSVQQTS